MNIKVMMVLLLTLSSLSALASGYQCSLVDIENGTKHATVQVSKDYMGDVAVGKVKGLNYRLGAVLNGKDLLMTVDDACRTNPRDNDPFYGCEIFARVADVSAKQKVEIPLNDSIDVVCEAEK